MEHGKEPCEPFFQKLVGDHKNTLDLSGLSAAWNTVSWIWGYAETYDGVAMTPQCAAQFRLVAHGDVSIWTCNVLDVSESLQKLGTPVRTVGELIGI
eukprot:2131547-Lingulodinium_polyedra.AAC.1